MIVVSVPRLAVAVVDLREPDASLGQTPRQQTAVREVARSVLLADVFRFVIQVEGFGRGELHAERGLHRRDARFELLVFAPLLQMLAVERPHQFELPLLLIGRLAGVAQIRDELLRIEVRVVDVRPLMLARQEGTRPEDREPHGTARTKDDVSRQTLVLRPEAI